MSASEPSKLPILVLCRDLLFASKITSTARAQQVPIELIRDRSKLVEKQEPARLLVDLSQSGFLEAAAEWKRRTGGHVTGFVGHLDAETIAKAKSEGLDAVMSRGSFAASLPQLLQAS